MHAAIAAASVESRPQLCLAQSSSQQSCITKARFKYTYVLTAAYLCKGQENRFLKSYTWMCNTLYGSR